MTDDTTPQNDRTDSRITLTKRKALGGLTVAGLASAGAGAGTFALFSDTEEVDGNTVTAGTLDLTVQGGSQSTALTVQNAAPGRSGAGQVTLNNQGSLDGYLNFQVGTASDGENGIVEPEDGSTGENGGQPGELSKWLQLRIGYDGNQNGDLGPNEAAVDGFLGPSNNAPGVPNSPGMEDVKFNPNAAVPAGQSRDLIVEWSIPEEAGNLIQSDRVEVPLTVELLQQPAPSTVVLDDQTVYSESKGFDGPFTTTTAESQIGSGSWQAGASGQQGIWYGAQFSDIHPFGTYTFSDIDAAGYWMKHSETLGTDFFLQIFTEARGNSSDEVYNGAPTWYNAKFTAVPTNSNDGSPSWNSGEWNEFGTESSAQNQLEFYLEDNQNVSTTPKTLSELQSNPFSVNGSTYPMASDEVLGVAVITNSAEPGFDGYLDNLSLTVDGRTMDVDLEP